MAANNIKDEGMRMVRQASDEGKNAALKVRKAFSWKCNLISKEIFASSS